jgi:acyl carrier protein
MDKSQIIQLVFTAVDEVNKQLPKAQRLEKSQDTIISGDGSQLDSMGQINLIFAVEQQIEQRFNVTVSLVEDGSLGGDANPFRTLGSLADYTLKLLEKEKNG